MHHDCDVIFRRFGKPAGSPLAPHAGHRGQAARSNGVWRVEGLVAEPTNCTAHVQTPILYRQHLYANSFDSFHNNTNNGLVCLDLAGKLKWKSGPEVTFDSGNLIIADGLIYLLHGATGELHLIEATPEAFRLLAKAKVLDAKGVAKRAPRWRWRTEDSSCATSIS